MNKELTPEKILESAADVIRKRGLYKVRNFDRSKPVDESPVCVNGAMDVVCYGVPYYPLNIGERDDLRDLRTEAALMFSKYLAFRGHTSHPCIISWNDDPARTAEEAIAALLDAAKCAR